MQRNKLTTQNNITEWDDDNNNITIPQMNVWIWMEPNSTRSKSIKEINLMILGFVCVNCMHMLVNVAENEKNQNQLHRLRNPHQAKVGNTEKDK